MKNIVPITLVLLAIFGGGYQVGATRAVNAFKKAHPDKAPMTPEEKDALAVKIFEFWDCGCKTALNMVKNTMGSQGDPAEWCEIQTAHAKKQWLEQQDE